MAARKPLVLVSGLFSELPVGDITVELAAAPSGLIYVSNKLGIDGSAQISGNAGISAAVMAQASGNAALVVGTSALASGNAALTSAALKLPLIGGTLTGDLTLNAQSDLRFADSDSSNYLALQAPATITSNVTMTLPAADGTNGQVLTTNGAGTLSFTTGAGGGSQWTTTGSDIYYTTGKVGIGVTAPSAPLDILANTGAEAIYVRADSATGISQMLFRNNANSATHFRISVESGSTQLRTVGSSFLQFDTNTTERLRITGAGLVGIGTTSPDALLTVNGVGAFGDGAVGTPSITNTGDLTTGFWFPAGSTIAASTGGSERLRLDSSGRLLVGTSTARGVGASSSFSARLQIADVGGVHGGISNFYYSNDGGANAFSFCKSRGASEGSYSIVNNADNLGQINWIGADGNGFTSTAAHIKGEVDGTPGANDMPGRLVFSTTADGGSSPTERMRITNSGVLSLSGAPTGFNGQDPVKFGISHNTNSVCVAHIEGYSGNGSLSNSYALRVSQNADANNGNSAALRIDHTNPAGGTGGSLIQAFGNIGNGTTQKLWEVYSYGQQVINRPANDGSLIDFQQAQTVEGSISVSGTTVSYNGAHLSRWSQLASGAERTEILRGTVLSNLDEMCEWIDAPKEAVLWQEGDELPEGVSVGDIKEPAVESGLQDNEQLNRMKVSEVEGDKNVSGVFQCWDDDDDTYTNDFYCAMTGDFIIRIAEGVTIERGDLLMSAGDGTAKPQDDDIIRSKTIAKVTSTNVSCTYDDGSYCVPCVLMAC